MSKFKAGDRVFSYSLQEWGKVVYYGYKYNSNYPLRVKFPSIDEINYKADGRISSFHKAPDLFFDEVTIEEPSKPLQDKDVIMCWSDSLQFERVFRFYDAKNECSFNVNGKRCGVDWQYKIYVPDEEAPQDFVALRDRLED